MKKFSGKIAVITGGGTGMGRELAIQLAREGSHIAICDVMPENMQRTRELCLEAGPADLRVTTHVADVSEEADVAAFQSEVAEQHSTDHIHLLFNNAGIGGAGSFLLDGREEWDKTFGVCWNGVYFCSRAFIPMLVAAPEAHLINTSSVNGFWATLGPMTSHTSYSAAKFAVKGFTEALINDFRNNAPHVKVSLVMPGHIGTSIVINSGKILGHDPKEMPDDQITAARERMAHMGFETEGVSNEMIRVALQARAEQFRDEAPMTAEAAATVILDGVREERWRILVGDDAVGLDELVRATPEEAYEQSFMDRLVEKTNWQLGS
jgi:NAD(P)-dependent dehydrogenase (short-subunit alcohol dehydrogenase family)